MTELSPEEEADLSLLIRALFVLAAYISALVFTVFGWTIAAIVLITVGVWVSLWSLTVAWSWRHKLGQ